MTVIILTGETHVTEIHSALKLGARAIVSKSDSLDHIVAACDAALAGEIYVSPHIGEALGTFQQPPEIGRASCRERVGQYVSISGVAVSLKKKTEQTEKE